jgi:hypothetical protein
VNVPPGRDLEIGDREIALLSSMNFRLQATGKVLIGQYRIPSGGNELFEFTLARRDRRSSPSPPG